MAGLLQQNIFMAFNLKKPSSHLFYRRDAEAQRLIICFPYPLRLSASAVIYFAPLILYPDHHFHPGSAQALNS
jgi:hypothetical protein